jgi:D-aspartate ligase
LIDASTPVMVACRGGDGSVSIARTLGRLGVATYLVAQEDMPTPVSSSRYWVEQSDWDFTRPEAETVAFLVDFGARIRTAHGKRAILLTVADWIAVLIERNARALEEQFVFPQPERPVLHEVLNKWGMHRLASQLDIPSPVTVYPKSPSDVESFVATVGFPIVMKAADPFVPDRPPTTLVRSREQLDALVKPREACGAPLNMVLQEYIPGGVDSVWMCNGYFGADRVVTFPGIKLRQVSAAGVASLAVCLRNDTVEAQTRRFMQGIGYRGCVGIGWRYDRRDGSYKVLDVNARVSGVFRLFEGTNEMDVVRICYLDLTGQDVPMTALQPGRKWMLEEDIRSALREVRSGNLTIREWVRSIRGVQEWHWLATDDPGPFLVWLRGIVFKALKRVVIAATARVRAARACSEPSAGVSAPEC